MKYLYALKITQIKIIFVVKMFKYSENCMALVLILYKCQSTDTQHNNNKLYGRKVLRSKLGKTIR